MSKQKWINLVQEVRNRPPPEPTNWKAIATTTNVAAIATVAATAVLALMVASGTTKKKAI